MNPALIGRAIRRHRHMQDLPAYRCFLEHVSSHGDAWLAPQGEIADWWEKRQAARLEFQRDGSSLVVRCALEGACVQIDAAEPRPIPVTLGDAPGEWRTPAYDRRLHEPFFLEVLGHLGLNHLVPSEDPAEFGQLSQERIGPVLDRLRGEAVAHQRFAANDVDALLAAVRAAHHDARLPGIRLWPLPASGGRPLRTAVSSRYDVDKAIVNLPLIHDLEERFGLRSTVYLRPVGMFYGRREIRAYLRRVGEHEIALHGEFITSAEQRFGDEFAAAIGEKRILEEWVDRPVRGVCMHGGELRTNTSDRTRQAIEDAGYVYETMYRNRYYLPLHLPFQEGVRRTLSIGQHFADISVPGDAGFSDRLCAAFIERYEEARRVGGTFVPVMHPLYFDLGHYLRQPVNLMRIAAFMPRFALRVARMRSGQHYTNEPMGPDAP